MPHQEVNEMGEGKAGTATREKIKIIQAEAKEETAIMILNLTLIQNQQRHLKKLNQNLVQIQV
ncbi:hypothetical protein BH18THE2_BH18THE2_15230 [soil metagenome]